MKHIISLKRRTKQRGATLVMFTILSACVLIPMVGLAIDGSLAFWAKAKLSAAVDAASLAAGRNINAQMGYAQNQPNVQQIANQWFFANFPQGWMGSSVSGGQPTISYPPPQNGFQTVSVSASATVPLMFLPVIGQKSVTVSAAAQSSRRSSFIVLVLDRSGSMGNPPVGTGVCGTMQQDAINFVNRFTQGFDTMSLVTFSTTANSNPIDVIPTQQFVTPMTNAINSLACTGATSTAQALQVAYQTIQSHGLPGGLNVIVLFTDGQPNEVVANYPIRTQADYRYGLYPPWWGSSYPYNQLFYWNSSTCWSSSPILGGISTLVDPNNMVAPGVQGMTGGIHDTTDQVAINSAPGEVSSQSASNCYFTQNGAETVRLDVLGIPTKDNWKNATLGGYGSNPPYYGGSVSAPDTITVSGNTYIRVDEQTTGIMAAAINAADYQAQVILNDSTYNPVIYTIGLGGAKDMPIDATLLERIANDPQSPIYNTHLKTGSYIYAPTSTQLNQAFDLVASQILRLSQ